MSRENGLGLIKVGAAGEKRFAKFLMAHSMAIPEAMVRFMAGPPTTERERFSRNVAETRTTSDWLRPH